MADLTPVDERRTKRERAAIDSRDNDRLAALNRELTIASRILDSTIERVEIDPGWGRGSNASGTNSYGARNDDGAPTKRTVIHKGQMPQLRTAVGLSGWVGAAFHEVAHSVYSPPPTSRLHATIDAQGGWGHLKSLIEVLEDRRAVRLFLDRFPRAHIHARSHAATVSLSWIEDEGLGALSWALMAGADWFSDEARNYAEAQWSEAMASDTRLASAAEIAQIVTDWMLLRDPGGSQANDAFNILVRLSDALGGRGSAAHENIASSTGQPDGSNRAGIVAGVNPDAIPEPSGDGSDPRDHPRIEQVARDDAEQVGDDIAADEDVAEELSQLAESIGLNPGRGAARIEFRRQPPRPEDMMLRDRLVGVFRDLRARVEPGVIKGVSSGRLNIGRVVGGEFDPLTAWDRFDPGALYETEFEVAAAIDISGSMQGSMDDLSGALWALHHACYSAHARLTVIGYSHGEPRQLIGPGDEPTDSLRRFDAAGGTEPGPAYDLVYSILRNSDRSNRLLISMTDGEWLPADPSPHLAAKAADEGATTVMLRFGKFSTGSGETLLGHESGGRVETLDSIPGVFAAVAAKMFDTHTYDEEWS